MAKTLVLTLALSVLTSFLNADASADGDVQIEAAYIVSRVERSTVATSEAKYPTVSQTTTLCLLLEARRNDERIYFSEAEHVELNGKRIPRARVSRWDTARYGELAIKWFKVEPTQQCLSNTEPEWHWEKVQYAETPFHRGGWGVKADVDPTHLSPQGGRGTMRFMVKVVHGGSVVSSPGAGACDKTGIKDCVHRISVRGDTGIPIIDWAYSFMNQPYIWGSASPTGRDEDHQAERYIGADCADFVVAAARRAGHKVSYGGTFSLSPDDARRETRFVCRKPTLGPDDIYYSGGEKVRIADDSVHLGDLVLYNRHVGILSKDLPPMECLSANDLIIHTLFREPREQAISEAYGSEFSIVRFIK
ncbi:MAG: hypothetical protein JW759_07415 [Candidatus Coatesbacteria bacterium]|nr:hypothetical protein [Candidatus Coatesbacteria bacterium]